MEIEHKLSYCDKCTHKEINDNNELICGITNTFPSPPFMDTCKGLLINEKETFTDNSNVENLGKKRPLFKDIFSYVGRITRTEYILSRILFFVLWVVAVALVDFYGENTDFFLILFPTLLWFRIASEIKRIHDKGHSWLYIFVPLYSIILIFSDGNKGDNQYGANPKGIK